jgi:AraC family transcriptional regulator of adaptative response/methylated-DNA-[protein]-cysteine methyltransferase
MMTALFKEPPMDESRPNPLAARAVAKACAANPVAILIPCHRVVRADGSLGGYRWGTDRKARLLDRESRAR